MKSELESFFEYLSIPSVSAAPQHRADLRVCADWLCRFLSDAGLSPALYETEGAPVVVAKTPALPGRTTLLIYGHYDVQPVEPLELWQTPPFEPNIRGEKVIARGATDNKGQTYSLLLGLKEVLEEGPLLVNLIVVVEGEEEIGSPNFQAFLSDHAEELACDAVLIADTSMVAPGRPALTLGLRGIFCCDVVVRGPSADLHSGMFGGAIPNPALCLAKVLGRMTNEAGEITIPGFYEGIIPLSESERRSWADLPWDATWFETTTGTAPTGGEWRLPVLERVWARPTAEINGLTSGHQGAGSKTIIPSFASAKLSFRLVPGQNSETVGRLIEEWFVNEFAKERICGEVIPDHGGEPLFTPPDNRFVRLAALAIEKVFGVPPAYVREGLSIPAAVMLQQTLSVPVVLLGLGLPDCGAHSPNESYPVSHLSLGARVCKELIRAFPQPAPVL